MYTRAPLPPPLSTTSSLVPANASLVPTAFSHSHLSRWHPSSSTVYFPHCLFSLESLTAESWLPRLICLFPLLSFLSSASSDFTASCHPFWNLCFYSVVFYRKKKKKMISSLSSLNSLWDTWLHFLPIPWEHFLRILPDSGLTFMIVTDISCLILLCLFYQWFNFFSIICFHMREVF